jgi:hypothetical protein
MYVLRFSKDISSNLLIAMTRENVHVKPAKTVLKTNSLCDIKPYICLKLHYKYKQPNRDEKFLIFKLINNIL